jgi:hypothetical protein
LFLAPVSMAVRVAAAGQEEGLDIAGTLFVAGAEPLTAAKRATVRAAGCDIFPRYGISELGWVGCACRAMTSGTAVHVMMDSVAVISHRRPAAFSDVEVDSLLITTLLPSSAYSLINVEMDDSGVLGEARLRLPVAGDGLYPAAQRHLQLRQAHRPRCDAARLEHPRNPRTSCRKRFGGVAGDYQLVERDDGSQTVTELRVNPRLEPPPPEQIRAFFLARVEKVWGGSPTYRQWTATDGLQVKLEEPLMSGDRKIHALHLLRKPE